jgi:hypothetical protein
VAFGVTGDFTALMAAADKIEEATGVTLNPCRVAFDSGDERIHWFFVNGGSYERAGEEAELTHLRTAINLARAERWALVEGMWAEWEVDDDYDPSQYDSPNMPEVGFGVMIHGPEYTELRSWCNYAHFNMASLWGITFEDDSPLAWTTSLMSRVWPRTVDHLKPYARIVCAELCYELMPDELSVK